VNTPYKRGPEQVVREFCEAWSRMDSDELLGYFDEDSVYHNMPMDAVTGLEGIRQVFDFFLPPSEEVDWQILNLAVDGNVVFTERLDRFVMGGKNVDLPIAGVFEVENGKIKRWRDYFDMATWSHQTA
jgi:limonene-1,2-epoxide hydrolase